MITDNGFNGHHTREQQGARRECIDFDISFDNVLKYGKIDYSVPLVEIYLMTEVGV